MNETPLVSLVILTYNQENFISEAINRWSRSWIEDSKAFIFECKDGEMRKYPIKDKKKAFSSGYSLHCNINIGDGVMTTDIEFRNAMIEKMSLKDLASINTVNQIQSTIKQKSERHVDDVASGIITSINSRDKLITHDTVTFIRHD